MGVHAQSQPAAMLRPPTPTHMPALCDICTYLTVFTKQHMIAEQDGSPGTCNRCPYNSILG